MAIVLHDVVFIDYNHSLVDLQGLNNISTINEGLWIENNNTLSSLSGLESLTSVIYFKLNDNNQLVSLEGLNSMEHQYLIKFDSYVLPIKTDGQELSTVQSACASMRFSCDIAGNLKIIAD